MWKLLIVVILAIFAFSMVRRSEGLRANRTRYVTFHYTDWCKCCAIMRITWDKIKLATEGSNIVLIERNEGKTKTPGIVKYPTILLVDEDGNAHEYKGTADFNELRNWIVSPAH